MLFICYERNGADRCQLCSQKQEQIFKVRFDDGLKCKCCTACLRVHPFLMSYLGPCREPETAVEKVVEQCGLAKFMGDAGLTDYDPLVVVMHLVAVEVEGLRLSLKCPKGRKTWCEAMRTLHEDGSLENNPFIPCRTCDHAFEPVIDEKLLALFLPWYEFQDVQDLIAIHRCPACGGQIAAERTKRYEGDMHTPEPGSVQDDCEWAQLLLQHSGL